MAATQEDAIETLISVYEVQPLGSLDPSLGVITLRTIDTSEFVVEDSPMVERSKERDYPAIVLAAARYCGVKPDDLTYEFLSSSIEEENKEWESSILAQGHQVIRNQELESSADKFRKYMLHLK